MGARPLSAGWDAGEIERVRERVAALATRFPGVARDEAHGHTGFMLKGRRLAWFLVDHHGDGRIALWVKAQPGEQAALVAEDPGRYFVPPYVGPSGWVGVQLDGASDADWDEVAALVEEAWRSTAGKRAVAAYDAGS